MNVKLIIYIFIKALNIILDPLIKLVSFNSNNRP